jgi:hypothetical protein
VVDCDNDYCLGRAKVGDRLMVNKQISQISYREFQTQQVKQEQYCVEFLNSVAALEDRDAEMDRKYQYFSQ